MKDSKEYSKKVRKLYRSLKREYKKPVKTVYDEPLEALVYAIISEDTTESVANTTMKKIVDNFVDFNDLRVSRTEEIIEALGKDTHVTRQTASTLTNVLAIVFDKYNMVSLNALEKIGKRPARQTLEKIEEISSFAVDYCMLTSLQGHAIPLTKNMITYLMENGLVHPEADNQQIAGFLARQISSENAYEFYSLLRRCSEKRRTRAKAAVKKKAETKAPTGKKAKKKTPRKTKAKAKTKTKKKG